MYQNRKRLIIQDLFLFGTLRKLTVLLQLGLMDKKLDALTYVLNALAQKQQIVTREVEDDV